jgi:hypothetical protein
MVPRSGTGSRSAPVRALNGELRHFAWDYSLSVMFADWVGDPSALAVVVNEWCRTNAPELLQQGSGYAFEADILDSSTYDVTFTLPLTERVIVTDRAGGGWNMASPAEAPVFDEGPIGGPLREIWRHLPGGDERILPLAVD